MTLADRLTVEVAAYAGIAGLAVWLRLAGLGWFALGPPEAAQALAAWEAAAGRPPDLAGLSPLLFTLQRLTFTALGSSEALARFWPALLNGLAVLLFFGLRDRLTRGGALLAALLWALSPMAIWVGRLGVGQALVPPLALGLLVAVARAWAQPAAPEARRFPWEVVGAVATGLLLASGPAAYTAVLIGLVTAAWQREQVVALAGELRPYRRRMLVAALLALGLGATCFFTAPAGLAAAFDQLGTWWRNLRPGPGTYGAWDLLRRLLISEPLLLGTGLAGLVLVLRRRDGFGLWTGLVAGITLLVPLISAGRHPTDLGLVTLALALLAGPAVARLLRASWTWRRETDAWLLFAISLALLTSAALAFPNYVNATLPNNVATYGIVALLTVLLSLTLWVVYGIWGSWQLVAQVVPLLPLLFGLAWGVGQMTSVNYDRDMGRKAAVVWETPDPNLADLRKALRELSALKGGGAREAKIDLLLPVAPADPVVPLLRWELRNFVALRTVRALPTDLAGLVLTPAEPQPETLSSRYSGAEWSVLHRWRPDGALKDTKSWLRWLLYREAPAGEAQKVVLWVERTGK